MRRMIVTNASKWVAGLLVFFGAAGVSCAGYDAMGDWAIYATGTWESRGLAECGVDVPGPD